MTSWGGSKVTRYFISMKKEIENYKGVTRVGSDGVRVGEKQTGWVGEKDN